jgi:hypothetical protein
MAHSIHARLSRLALVVGMHTLPPSTAVSAGQHNSDPPSGAVESGSHLSIISLYVNRV